MEDQMVVALGCRKTKKLIWGMKGKKVAAFDRLPSPMSQRNTAIPTCYHTVHKFYLQAGV